MPEILLDGKLPAVGAGNVHAAVAAARCGCQCPGGCSRRGLWFEGGGPPREPPCRRVLLLGGPWPSEVLGVLGPAAHPQRPVDSGRVPARIEQDALYPPRKTWREQD